MTRRRDDPPHPGSAPSGAPSGAPPWVVGDVMHDMGGPDGTVEYRADEPFRHEPPVAHKQVFDPGTMIAPSETVDRVVVDLYTPNAAGAKGDAAASGAGWAAASSGAMARTLLEPGFAPAPAPLPVEEREPPTTVAASEPGDEPLFEWLARRGIAPAYFSSYTRARDIIWGGTPDGRVDPADVEHAVQRRGPSATPQQLDNLRDLGTLLVQFFGTIVRTPVMPFVPPRADAPPSDGLEFEDWQAVDLRPATDAQDVRLPVQVQPADAAMPRAPLSTRGFSSPATTPAITPDRRHPTTEVELEVEYERPRDSTPVPRLLQESAADLQLDHGELEAALLEGPVGATPLIEVRDEAPPPFASNHAWTFPAGFASPWDPRVRDQGPPEIRRPPRFDARVRMAAIVLVVLVVLALGYALSR